MFLTKPYTYSSLKYSCLIDKAKTDSVFEQQQRAYDWDKRKRLMKRGLKIQIVVCKQRKVLKVWNTCGLFSLLINEVLTYFILKEKKIAAYPSKF